SFPRPLVGPSGGPHGIQLFVSILRGFGLPDDTCGDGSASGPLGELLVWAARGSHPAFDPFHDRPSIHAEVSWRGEARAATRARSPAARNSETRARCGAGAHPDAGSGGVSVPPDAVSGSNGDLPGIFGQGLRARRAGAAVSAVRARELRSGDGLPAGAVPASRRAGGDRSEQ